MRESHRHLAIRRYRASDAPALAQLYFDSARSLGARRNSEQQVAVWAPAPAGPATVHARASDRRTTLVAVDAQREMLGYGALEADGHIDPFTAGQMRRALVSLARCWMHCWRWPLP